MEFLSNYGLIILLVVLLGFMFWSSRRRTQKQKIEQEKKARETVPGAEVLMQGGHNPDLPLTWYEDLFRAIKTRYPEFMLHALSPPEVIHLSRLSLPSLNRIGDWWSEIAAGFVLPNASGAPYRNGSQGSASQTRTTRQRR